jgi:recombination protein RecA
MALKKKTTKKGLDSFLSFMAKHDKALELLRLTDDDLASNVRGYLSSRSLALNRALGLPGFPRGRLIEFSGPEHAAKSTLLDHLLAEAQAQGGVTYLIETESGRDEKYSRALGVDPKRLLLPEPVADPKKGKGWLTLEDVFNSIDHALEWQLSTKSDQLLVIGVDSVANLPSREDLTRGAGERKPGEGASILRHVFRSLSQKLLRTGAILVLVNQLYQRIGHQGYGDPRIEWGGGAIPYQAAVRIRLTPGQKIKGPGGEVVGIEVRAQIRKTKVSDKSYAECILPVRSGVGVDNVWTIFDEFKKTGHIAQSGSWHSLVDPESGEAIKWQGGWMGLGAVLAERPGLYAQLAHVYEQLWMTPQETQIPVVTEEE